RQFTRDQLQRPAVSKIQTGAEQGDIGDGAPAHRAGVCGDFGSERQILLDQHIFERWFGRALRVVSALPSTASSLVLGCVTSTATAPRRSAIGAPILSAARTFGTGSLVFRIAIIGLAHGFSRPEFRSLEQKYKRVPLSLHRGTKESWGAFLSTDRAVEGRFNVLLARFAWRGAHASA